MMMLASTLDAIGIVDAGIVALLGYAVVFLGLVLLMGVITIMGKAFVAAEQKAAQKAAAAKEAMAANPVVPTFAELERSIKAPGSAGQLKLHDVEPKTAAMLMAIVANQMGKPLNELRFISIKEVK